jgi:serine/threonine protein kinase
MSFGFGEDAGKAGQIPMEQINHQEQGGDKQHRTEYTDEEGDDTSSSDSDDEEDNLRDQLLASMELSHFEKTPHEFLPRDKFDEIFFTQSKCEEGQNLAIFEPMGVDSGSPTDDDRSMANYVLEHCRTLYLITVFIELKPEPLRTLMSIFRRNGFTDENLPIDMWPMDRLKAGTKQHPLHPFVEMEQRHDPAHTRRIWNLMSIEKFQREQWKFLVPTISTAETFHDFRRYTIPFVAKHNVISKGGSGIVHKYEIHHAHFDDPLRPTETNGMLRASSTPNLLSNVVAVKEIRVEGNEVARRWRKEVRALAEMNEFNDAHIVRFITSFRRRGISDDIEHYIIFEWADGGNLRDFWAAYPNPEMTVELIKWIIQQLYGVAQALSKVHYLEEERSYRHGYMEPENIVWFKQGDTEFGTLKIGDWTEATEHFNGTTLGHSTMVQYGTRRYEPPEVSTGLELNLSRDSRFARSRLYDIWGIGCITLEVLIWVMYGLTGLIKFNRLNEGDYGISETLYEVSRGNPTKVHAVAEGWMEKMAEDPRCSRNKTALGDLLDIVRTGLLVVKLPPDGGAKRPQLHPHAVSKTPNRETSEISSNVNTEDNLVTENKNEVSIGLIQELQDPALANPGEPTRYLATDFRDQLQKILAKESYWYKGNSTKPELDHIDDFATSSTLQGQSSAGTSQETLVEIDQSSDEAKDSLNDNDSLETDSVNSHVTTSRERDGKAQIAHFLATDPELRLICSSLLEKSGQEWFVKEGHRLLKTFYLELLTEVQSELQIQSVRLLKSRNGRVRISRDVAEIISSADVVDAEKEKNTEQNRLRRERLNKWAGNYVPNGEEKSKEIEQIRLRQERLDNWAGTDMPASEQWLKAGQHEPSVQAYSQTDQESFDTQGDEDDQDIPSVSQVEAFFRNSRSFQALINDFRSQLLPHSVRDIVSATSVELSNRDDNSHINRLKVWVEDYTMLDWSWWPLEPCMRPLKPNQSRVLWQCVSESFVKNSR